MVFTLVDYNEFTFCDFKQGFHVRYSMSSKRLYKKYIKFTNRFLKLGSQDIYMRCTRECILFMADKFVLEI